MSRRHSILCALFLAGCGGSGIGIGDTGPLPASSTLAEQCASPRPAGTIDPIANAPYGDVQGSLDTEKAFLRSWIDETYLWYQDVRLLTTAKLDRHSYSTPLDYFDALKTPLLDAQGQAKDKFHFIFDTPQWDSLALSGVAYGYDVEIALPANTPPRKAVVAFISDGAATGQGGLARGTVIFTVDGVDVVAGNDVDTLNNGLFPTGPGAHTFVVQDQGSTVKRTVQVNAQAITESPVQNVKTLSTPTGTVGYLLFNDHIATAESQLIAAINQLKTAAVTGLVLDLRYNGGGFLDIAAELAYMIAGPGITTGRTFDKQSYNDRNPFNFTAADVTTDFHATAQGFSTESGTPLPSLNLTSVYVLTSADTCSASEAVINGLRGVGVTVALIGGTTCGKPYGFFPQDNCGTTYFSIQFQGVNDQGFGDYPDGFAPDCSIADDYSHALGDPLEAQLNVALGLRASGVCHPLVSAVSPQAALMLAAEPAKTPALVRNPFRENLILRRR
ncbi:MAG TPA: S41 family peptidase [Myxococcales bacterium]|nr:S41 family peptidase [Myxococcales bacterium]